MSRRKRNAKLDDFEAVLAWAGLAGLIVGLTVWPTALVVTAAAIAMQAVRGRVR